MFFVNSWILGRSPEFVDPKFISQGEGRECKYYIPFNWSVLTLYSFGFTVTKTRSQGHVTVSVNIVSKDLWKQGYRNGASEPRPSFPTGETQNRIQS